MSLNLDQPLPPEDWIGNDKVPINWDSLYRAQFARLSLFFSRRVAADDVLDLVHETFGRFLRANSQQIRPIVAPEAYLTRVADNLVRDRARRARRQSRDSHVPFDEEEVEGIDPLDALELRDAASRVDEALLELSEKTRTIFLLHRVGGHSYADIAAARGMSVKRVEKHMSKALFQLRRRLRPHE
jgi:RNA polymerase sigma-70 factor (ECF subfamily)